MGIKLTNNANATLAAGIDSSATSITLTSGQGARFPTLAGGDYFYATLVDTSNNLEIVKCTARSTDVLTVVRAQESTTARAYVTGDRIEIRLTAQTFIDAVNEIGPTQVSDEANTATGYFALPSGTTAQRPGSPVSGMIRYNTTLSQNEIYQSGGWQQFSFAYSIESLVVAGGGGGGAKRGGGGGAGGLLSNTASTVTVSVSYPITVGAGGNGSSAGADDATNGSNSSAFNTTSIGGGRGAGYAAANQATAGSGGSGGGGARGESSSPSSTGGSGTSGQGNAGGSSNPSFSNGAGGGGAGAAGASVTSGTGGVGGVGVNWQSLGTFYAGGGGGGGATTAEAGGAGGNGGGGYGGGASPSPSTNGTSGTANTGGGGGGAGDSPAFIGGNGGSGVVIVRYAGAQRGTGGTVTSSGGFTIHTFTSSGTFTA